MTVRPEPHSGTIRPAIEVALRGRPNALRDRREVAAQLPVGERMIRLGRATLGPRGTHPDRLRDSRASDRRRVVTRSGNATPENVPHRRRNLGEKTVVDRVPVRLPEIATMVGTQCPAHPVREHRTRIGQGQRSTRRRRARARDRRDRDATTPVRPSETSRAAVPATPARAVAARARTADPAGASTNRHQRNASEVRTRTGRERPGGAESRAKGPSTFAVRARSCATSGPVARYPSQLPCGLETWKSRRRASTSNRHTSPVRCRAISSRRSVERSWEPRDSENGP